MRLKQTLLILLLLPYLMNKIPDCSKFAILPAKHPCQVAGDSSLRATFRYAPHLTCSCCPSKCDRAGTPTSSYRYAPVKRLGILKRAELLSMTCLHAHAQVNTANAGYSKELSSMQSASHTDTARALPPPLHCPKTRSAGKHRSQSGRKRGRRDALKAQGRSCKGTGITLKTAPYCLCFSW